MICSVVVAYQQNAVSILVPRPSHVSQCKRGNGKGQVDLCGNDYTSAIISTNHGTNGGRYIIITSPKLTRP